MAYGPTKCVTCKELGCPTEGMTKMCSKCGGIYCFGHFGRHREEKHNLCYLCDKELPCPEHDNPAVKQFEKDHDFIGKNKEEWGKQYPGKYIAVFGEELIGVSDNIEELAKLIKERNISPPFSVAVRFISKDGKRLISIGW